MNININSIEKIEKALNEANGKLQNTLDSYDIQKHAIKTEKKISGLLTKAQKKGMRIKINGFSGSLAKSYKYKLEFTYAILHRGTNDWFVVEVGRNSCYAGGCVKQVELLPTDEQKETLKANLYTEWAK